MSPGGEPMVKTEQVSVLMSVHDRRLDKPMVQDKIVMDNWEESALAN